MWKGRRWEVRFVVNSRCFRYTILLTLADLIEIEIEIIRN